MGKNLNSRTPVPGFSSSLRAVSYQLLNLFVTDASFVKWYDYDNSIYLFAGHETSMQNGEESLWLIEM